MTRYIVALAWTLALLGSVSVKAARAQPCAPSPSDEFAADPLDFAPSAVNAFIDFNDGTGFKTYACGSFRTAGGVSANTVASWNGSEWHAVGEGPIGTGRCFAIFNNTLYMGGSFGAGDPAVACVFRWTGSQWLPMLDGPRGASVNAMTVWNDGTGNALYAVGNFVRVGASSAIRAVVKFNGTTWSQLGAGLPQFNTNIGNAVIGYDDGLTPALYVGGQFGAGGSGMLAKWDRVSWNTSAGPSASIGSAITAFHVFADAQGTALWAAVAPQAFGAPMLYRYGSNRSWIQVSVPSIDTPSQVFALASYNDGTGNALYLGGQFYVPSAAGGAARTLIRYNGTTWTAVGPNGGNIFGPITALSVRTGTRVGLLAGGVYAIGPQVFNSIALWNGTSWQTLTSGLTNPGVQAITFAPGTADSDLYAIGTFLGTRGPMSASPSRAAHWDGTRWDALGSGVNGARSCAFVGSTLYVAGAISIPGQSTPGAVARWNGSDWQLVPGLPSNSQVTSITSFDDGGGPVPCVALKPPATGPAVYVIRNGIWTTLGGPFQFPATIVSVKQLADGALYAMGGALQGTAGIPGERTIARWDGMQWVYLPVGPTSYVYDMELFDGALYASGQMTYYESQGIAHSTTLARLAGTTWTYPTSDKSGTISALAVWNDGSGDALYLGGSFIDAERGIANLARLRNGNIEPYFGANAVVNALRVHGRSLYAGGPFSSIGSALSPGLARWTGCPPCVGDFDNGGGLGTRDGGVTIDDLLYYIAQYSAGNLRADIDDGSGMGTPDGGVTMEDLLYYLRRYTDGC